MFLCEKCRKACLTAAGLAHCWVPGMGECGVCETFGRVEYVPTSAEWPWDWDRVPWTYDDVNELV